MKKTNETSTTWWDKLSIPEQIDLATKYNLRSRMLYYNSLTDSEIEEIWSKEVIEKWGKETKSNQKQFKQFDESLFKAYIDKFSDEDKVKAHNVICKLLNMEERIIIYFYNGKELIEIK